MTKRVSVSRRAVSRRTAGLAGLALAVVAVGSACAGDEGPAAVGFTVSEFIVQGPGEPVPAGRVEVEVTNRGVEPHELVIVRAESVEALPRAENGAIDETAIPDADRIGEVEGIAAGTSETKAFDLPPGDYVALCNIVEKTPMSGMADDPKMSDDTGMDHSGMDVDHGDTAGGPHNHFVEGMHTAFSVR